MKILYAVQATGNGHIGRARVMAAAFKKQNIQVDWVFSGRRNAAFFDMESFGDYKTFQGLSFIIKNNKINVLSSFLKADLWQFYKDVKAINFSGYDLLINDFEPITAWAAKLQKIKSIGLSHQSAFLYKMPFVKRNFLFNLCMKYFAPVTMPIGIHWQQFNENIIPPIIADNPNKIENFDNEIIVYIPFHSAAETIDLLKNFPEYEFHIFRNDKVQSNYKNLIFHSFSCTEFAKKMARCNGIITNAGFELPSEALQMGKKLLIEPLQNQTEQISNANILEQFNWSRTEKKITPEHIKQWLKGDEPKQIKWGSVANQLAKWIKTGKGENLKQLSDDLWKKVTL